MSQLIRNFCIIAHIDHGKSTLADRFLEITETVNKRDMKEQVLDQMDLERERGITIKLQPVRMDYQGYNLNLIDTPGHVDFSYEVSRSLAAVEGAILLVDATQGIEAQTLSNLYLAIDLNLTIIPVINKIDLPNADIKQTKKDLKKLIGCLDDEIFEVSAKTGQGVKNILEYIIKKIPSPQGQDNEPLQMLIFDSLYDDYKGVIAYGRVMNGQVQKSDHIKFMASQKDSECLEVGFFKPKLIPYDYLKAGDIGYVVTGLKQVQSCRVGDTITLAKKPAVNPLPGYKVQKPMVFAGLYSKEGDDYPRLREALERLSLNDASFTYEADRSEALGFGFRCGFLGILHLDIFQERIFREYNIDLIITAPSVGYKVELSEAGQKAWQRKDKSFNKKELIITSPQLLPESTYIDTVNEPWVRVDIVTPTDYLGNIMNLVQEKRGVYLNTEYIDDKKAILHYELPLVSILIDFYDKLKSVSSGYASLNYDFLKYQSCEVVRLDILIANEPAESLATIVYKDEAYRAGRKITDKLKEILPRQLFEVKIQAAIGSKIIASSRISPLRKDVTAKLYGGDVSRKRKLLEKQKKGKKKMKQIGKVDIPHEAYLAVLKR
ncbi:translation elongation factor 4 [Patescibacteria group bacterium]|nr:translation elongation factor 4 [Patescibacteria group bacterium]